MEYYNHILNKIVQPRKISIRKVKDEDENNSESKPPTRKHYIVKEKNSASHTFSDMGLVTRFCRDIRLTNIPLEVEFDFEIDSELYPDEDPRETIKVITENHNISVAPYNTLIRDTPSPFTERIYRVFTRDMALSMIDKRKKDGISS